MEEYKNVVVDAIKSWIENETKKIAKYVSEYNDNFMFSFNHYSQIVYSAYFMIKELKFIVEVIEQEKFTSDETISYIKSYIEIYEKNLLDGEVMRNSTNELSNVTFLWERNCQQTLRKMYLGYVKMLS